MDRSGSLWLTRRAPLCNRPHRTRRILSDKGRMALAQESRPCRRSPLPRGQRIHFEPIMQRSDDPLDVGIGWPFRPDVVSVVLPEVIAMTRWLSLSTVLLLCSQFCFSRQPANDSEAAMSDLPTYEQRTL